MKDFETLEDLSDTSLIMNKVAMKVIVQKLEAISTDEEFRLLLVHAFNSLVLAINHDKLPITGGMYINLLAIALDNKLNPLEMMSDATKMMNTFETELKRRQNAAS